MRIDVHVKLFGPQARSAGTHTITLNFHDSPTCAKLRDSLATHCPPLAPSLPACRFAINHQFASDDTRIEPNDEVALIGPVSGG